MAYEYYTDGGGNNAASTSVARINLDNDTYAGQERFSYRTLDWIPNKGDDIHAAASVGELLHVSEADAMIVCDLIRQRVAADRASA